MDNTHGSHCISNTSFGFAGDELEVSSGYDVNSLGIGLFSPGGQSSLHLSNQVEQSQAYTWIMSHLEEDPSTCLRKDEVYDDYRYIQRLAYSLVMSIGSMLFRCYKRLNSRYIISDSIMIKYRHFFLSNVVPSVLFGLFILVISPALFDSQNVSFIV